MVKNYAGNGKPVAYISGPITGVEGYRRIFAAAVKYLESKGYIVINPAILPEGMEHSKYLPINFAMIDASEIVFLLDGYDNSLGCSSEIMHSESENKKMKRLPTECFKQWLQEGTI